MAYTDTLDAQTNALKQAQQNQLYQKYQGLKSDTNNQIGQTNTDYQNTLSDLNTQQTQGVNDQNFQKKQGDQGYLQQSDQAGQAVQQQTNRVQDWLAAHNLSLSGENVDAQLQGNTNMNNALHKVNSDNNTFDTGIQQKIGDLYNTYGQKKSAATLQNQSAIQALKDKLASYDTGYQTDLNSAYQTLDAQKNDSLAKYQLQLQSEQATAALQAQAQAAAAAKTSATTNKTDALNYYASQLMDNMKQGQGANWLTQNQDALVQDLGASGYSTLKDTIYDPAADQLGNMNYQKLLRNTQ